MKVVERFVSINGEGTRAGELAVFIRFQGCNLRCGYCDTMWANQADCKYEEYTPEQIVAYVKSTSVKNVTLTGGEPLLQQDMPDLLGLLGKEDFRVEIETNGAIDIATFCGQNRPVFTMDYKLPSSNCESKMKIENFALLQTEDTVKFVVGNSRDLERAGELIERYNLTKKCHVYLSPVFASIEPVEIVEYMMEHCWNDVRLQIQMHKVIWDPNKRGV